MDPNVAAQRRELADLERDYAVQSRIFKPDWPAMVELRSRIDQLRSSLQNAVADSLKTARETARAEYQNTLRREQALAAELSRVKAESRELSSAAVEYTNLQVEISTRRAMLDELLRRQSETEVASRLQAQGESNVRVVDRALVPSSPFRPSLRRNLTWGLGGGLGFGIAWILLLHYLDRTIKSQEEVERLLALPVLAVIPDVSAAARRRAGTYGSYGYGYGYGARRRQNSASASFPVPATASPEGKESLQIELLPLLRPRLAVAEAYRVLRTALLLSTARELKLLVVTSALPGEGKTSTAVNLAIVFAQLGKRVLLVDADLRRPRVHDVFRIVNRVGLVNFLTHSAEAEQVVFRTQVDNLFLTPSGPIPPNPSELLSSERMEQFLEFVRQHFDFVVLDTAPTLAVSDGVVLGARVDGALLCLFSGHVERREAKACRDRLVQGGVKLLGAVLNRHQGFSTSYRSGYLSNSSGAYGLEELKSAAGEEAPGA
jgi:capsular exopolysaccharide synthesis family protein